MEEIRPRIRVAGILIENDKILLIQHYKNNKKYWLIPGGGNDWGETAKEALIREYKEETNMDIEVDEFLFFSETIYPNKERHILNLFFRIHRNEKNDSIIKLGDEAVLTDLKFVTKEELKKMTVYPNIKENLLKLMRQKKQLSVSEVLRAISFNGRVPYYSANDDFENFHNFVTRYLIESGWLIDFPKIILRVQGIAMLRLSIFKYILRNWNWIIAIYDFRVLEELAIHYGQVSLKNSAIEEDALRREFIRKVLKQEIAELEQKLEENILKIIDGSERNDFFIKK